MHVQNTAIRSYENHLDVWRAFGTNWRVGTDHEANLQHVASVVERHVNRSIATQSDDDEDQTGESLSLGV